VRRLPLSERLMPERTVAVFPEVKVNPAWQRKGTVYVLGVDGATLDVVRPLVEAGRLPAFARLAREGCHGPLQTISPTDSPVLWASIATGRHHRRHGIDGFTFYELLGRRVRRGTVRRLKKLGLRALVAVLERRGLLQMKFFDARHLKARPFWALASRAGWRVGVVNWWHTGPAEPVNGFVVSDRLHYWRAAQMGREPPEQGRLTYPEELLEEIEPLVVRPKDVGADLIRRYVNASERECQEFLSGPFRHHELSGELRFMVSLDLTCLRVLERCLDEFGPLDMVAAYFRGVDIAQHCAFKYMPSARREAVSAAEREKFGQVVPRAYEFADEVLARVMERMGPDDTLFVLSDHGFGFQPRRGTYGHARGRPPGVFYVLGREFRRGVPVKDATIYDLAPTLLRVCGFHPERGMEGRCLEELLTEEFRREHPPLEPISAEEPRAGPPSGGDGSRRVEDQMKEHLKALGYLD